MKKLFSPGISLINRLNYPQKLLLIGFIIMLPITVIMYLEVLDQNIELISNTNDNIENELNAVEEWTSIVHKWDSIKQSSFAFDPEENFQILTLFNKFYLM